MPGPDAKLSSRLVTQGLFLGAPVQYRCLAEEPKPVFLCLHHHFVLGSVVAAYEHTALPVP